LESIQGIGKSRFRCLTGFKFLPELAKQSRLIVGQDIENPLGSKRFPLELILSALIIVALGISGIYLDQVMN
jgi:hypothetical protein